MKKICLFIVVISLLCSCTIHRDFNSRRYMPGLYLPGYKGTAGADQQKQEAAKEEEKPPVITQPVAEPQLVARNSLPETVQAPGEEKPARAFEEISTLPPVLPVLAADTIPPQTYIATDKELKNIRFLSTLGVMILLASWLALPVIGGLWLFLIHFVIGGITLMMVEYCAENNDGYIKSMGVIAMISVAAVILLGAGSLIYCTFFRYCG
ncbi:MAG: hypothetical protein AB1458_12320 [Bacteroidota bacterium]